MTQEEKAKAYDKVREKIAIRFGSNVADEIFSQFEMSEDERIRKEIISALKFANVKGVYDEHISWLEKQGEEKEYTFKSIPRLLDMIEPTDRAKAYCQKLIDTLAKEGYNTDAKIVEDVLKGWNGEDVPMAVMDEQKPVNDTEEDIVEAVKDVSILDMVEPKFKVGDWIVYYRNDSSREILYVYDIRDGRYYLNDNIHLSWSIKECNEKCHLWTIQDAKDGDVVVDKSIGDIGIFESIGNHPDGGSCNDPSYCYLHCRYDDGFFYADFEDGNTIDSDDLIPATKAQRVLLFKKMHEAGYEWDAEKLELYKKPKFKIGDFIVNDYCFGKVIEITNDAYLLDTDQGIPFSYEHNAHLWTIQDAKDGDVLAYVTDEEDLWIMIYCSLYEPYEGHVHYHALLVNDNFSDKGTCCICIDNLKPATKEQRDLLFAKMNEAGYEWDAEKKEVKLLITNGGDFDTENCEQKPTDKVEPNASRI